MNDQAGSLRDTKFISVKEAALKVGYTTDYVARLARAGKIDSTKDGARRLIDLESLKLFELSARAEKQRRQEALRAERLREQEIAQRASALTTTAAVSTPAISAAVPSPLIPSPVPALVRSLALFTIICAGIGGVSRTQEELASIAMRVAAEPHVLADAGAYGAHAYVAFADAANVHVTNSSNDFAVRIGEAHRALFVEGRTIVHAYETILATVRSTMLASTIDAYAYLVEKRTALEGGFDSTAVHVADAVREGTNVLYAFASGTSYSGTSTQTASVWSAFGEVLCDGFGRPLFDTDENDDADQGGTSDKGDFTDNNTSTATHDSSADEDTATTTDDGADDENAVDVGSVNDDTDDSTQTETVEEAEGETEEVTQLQKTGKMSQTMIHRPTQHLSNLNNLVPLDYFIGALSKEVALTVDSSHSNSHSPEAPTLGSKKGDQGQDLSIKITVF